MSKPFSNPFDNSYSRLPDEFFRRQPPLQVSSPGLIKVNCDLAQSLGIDPQWLTSGQGVEFIAGNYLPPGSDPIATVYAGHQFGGFNPRLGDGRAVLIGEIVTADGQRYDLQLKGSGPTPYSRGGDGRSPLGPVLREYVVSEAMAVLGVPTTRALAAATTGDMVMRERPLPGAVLARVAKSHIRIGTLQYFAARKNSASLRLLVDYIINRHYPNSKQAKNPVLAMLNAVICRQAELIAQWQSLGFIHGVMNTDNMLISGETIDYGPCAFLDEFEPGKTFSSIDHGGRYAYSNQPQIGHWNLSVLAQLLLPLLHDDQELALAEGQAAIDAYPDQYQSAYTHNMRAKLGFEEKHDTDVKLIQDLLQLMHQEKLDYTLTFRRLSDLSSPHTPDDQGVKELIELTPALDGWFKQWQQRIGKESRVPGDIQKQMYAANPVFIPRNHLLQQVIEAAAEKADFRPFNQLLEVLRTPFEYRPAERRFALPPENHEIVQQTFCGT